MSAPVLPVTRPSIPDQYVSTSEGLGLSELLDLLALEHSAVAPTPARPPAGSRLTGLRVRMQEWVRRAAGWGAGPQGAWRAW